MKMKGLLLAMIVSCAALGYGQMGGGMGGMGGGPVRPTPNTPPYDTRQPGMDNNTPLFDQAPKDAFTHNANLAGKLQSLLPEGSDINQVCDGFKKLGDCVSAIHVSQNLGVPLSDLKAKVTGKSAEKFENAIHDLKPDVDAKAEKKKAYKQAEKEIPFS